MHELDDHTLLRQYADHNSEAAFAALVTRHVDKVYSTALRHTRNAHAAEEITQAVFVIFARKAKSLRRHPALSGWFYETARLTALTYIRSEIRRARREQEAHMQTALNENTDDAWPHIAPLLDDAMGKLSAADRHAIVLRYFDGKSLGEVGAALGASEDAAKKRVTRAVEKLRGWFTKRGVTLTATVLTAAISANSVQAAPLGLAATVTAAVKGTLISATIITLVKGTTKTMTWLKIKFSAVVCMATLLVGGAAIVAISGPPSNDTGDGFQVQGYMTRNRPDAPAEHFCNYTVVVKGKKSFITVRYFNGESFACGTDGHDSYLLNEMIPAKAKNTNAMQLGCVSDGPFPTKAVAPIQLLWLAYASSAAPNKENPNWQLEGLTGDDHKAVCEVKRSGKFPGLPVRVVWTSPGLETKHGTTSFLVYYPDGFKSVEYISEQPTNFMGLTMPAAWTCHWFLPTNYDLASTAEIAKLLRESSTSKLKFDDVKVSDTLECLVTNITRTYYTGDFRPPLSCETSIEDWRFEKQVGHGIIIPRRMTRGANGKLIPDPAYPWPVWPQKEETIKYLER